ncbi:MAG: hypothetical protein EAZ75_09800 [Flavobacteriia bacterium]|nr:MAG: hypothetical protein EAZ75_09800 [Flavobacteriia bacterium]
MENITIIILLLGFLPILFLFKKDKLFKSFGSIVPFVFLIFLSSSYELIFTYFYKINVSFWFLVYNILSFFCIFYFFYFELNKKNKLFFFLIFKLFIILLIYFYYNFNIQDILIINSHFKIFITSFILISTTLWFVKLINEGNVHNLLQTGSFYFIAGFVLYYCGTLFLFLLSDQLYKTDSRLFVYYWGINIFLNFVLRSLVIVGLWKLRIK